MKVVRTNQGGSILGFVIIGGVMALLLIGGAYFVRHNLTSTAEEAPVATDDESTADPSTGEGAADEGENEASQPDENGSVNQEGSESDPAPSSEPTPVDTPDHADDHQTGSESSSPDNLPATGPGDMLAVGLLLGGVVGALAAYIRSRALSSSL